MITGLCIAGGVIIAAAVFKGIRSFFRRKRKSISSEEPEVKSPLSPPVPGSTLSPVMKEMIEKMVDKSFADFVKVIEPNINTT